MSKFKKNKMETSNYTPASEYGKIKEWCLKWWRYALQKHKEESLRSVLQSHKKLLEGEMKKLSIRWRMLKIDFF